MRRIFAFSLLVSLGGPLCMGAERVMYLSKDAPYGGVLSAPPGHQWFWHGKILHSQTDLATVTFSVYTTAEVDTRVKTLTDGVAENAAAIKTATERCTAQVNGLEKEIRDEVTSAIDKLPQRVLTDVAAQALKDAAIEYLKAEIERLNARIAALENQRRE